MNRMSSSLLFALLMPAAGPGVGVRDRGARVGVVGIVTTTSLLSFKLRLSHRDETRKGFGFFGGDESTVVAEAELALATLELRFCREPASEAVFDLPADMTVAAVDVAELVDTVLMLSDVCGDRANGFWIRSLVSFLTWTMTPGRSGHLGGLFGASFSVISVLLASVSVVVVAVMGTSVVIPGVSMIVLGGGDKKADADW